MITVRKWDIRDGESELVRSGMNDGGRNLTSTFNRMNDLFQVYRSFVIVRRLPSSNAAAITAPFAVFHHRFDQPLVQTKLAGAGHCQTRNPE